MVIFKPGDKVMCKDTGSSRFLKKGSIYTIKESTVSVVRIRELVSVLPLHGYTPDQFELAFREEVLSSRGESLV